jgi:hypothetical protein
MECQPDLQSMATEVRRETGTEGAQEGNRPLMTDTTPIVDTIRYLISTGSTALRPLRILAAVLAVGGALLIRLR